MSLFTTLPLRGGDYRYVKGAVSFEVEETRNEYKVYCTRIGGGLTSRNKNIADRQLRMTAIDLMGTYILYKSSELLMELGPEFFPVYVEGINLHYNAYLEGVRQEDVVRGGEHSICYSCDKDNYNITDASYQDKVDIPKLLVQYYNNAKNESSSALLYKYPGFTSAQYLMMERDFLTGDALLPEGIRKLQAQSDRFEQSVYGTDASSITLPGKGAEPQKVPYSHFFYEEMVTASPLKGKESAYREWQKRLQNNSVYEDILLFCSEKCRQKTPSMEEASFCSVISAFPGAVSPFGIRQPIDNASYHRAAQSYSKSQFEEAVTILEEIVDTEGISPEILNLLGASLRFLGKYNEAMPYLLLCFKLSPKTQYLAGNLFLCLRNMGFNRMDESALFLYEYAIDSWSQNEILK